MGEVERIILRRLYIGKASLFGLYYGAFTGLILGAIAFLAVLVSNRFETWLGETLNMSGFALAFILAVIIFISITIIGLISAFLAVLIYNIVASFGGEINFDLEEYIQVKDNFENRVESKPVSFAENIPAQNNLQGQVNVPVNTPANLPSNLQRNQQIRQTNQYNQNYNQVDNRNPGQGFRKMY